MDDTDVEFVPMAAGVEVAVPASNARLTTYVLKEQGDWYEDELGFCRRVFEPGGRVVDVGASYGVYALAAAKAVGPAGRVWAFEPAAGAATLLRRSAERAGFNHLTVVQAALTDHEGTGALYTARDTELSSLQAVPGVHDGEEPVVLRTLDSLALEHGFEDLSFLKVDAAGEGARILAGGERLLAEQSPLVMFELMHGDRFDSAVVAALEGQAYAPFRLVPGLGLLVPFVSDLGVEPATLNLFGVKPPRLEWMERRGLLTPVTPSLDPLPDLSEGAEWVRRLPYGRRLSDRWKGPGPAGAEKNLQGLAEWARAQDPRRPPAERFGRLTNAFRLLTEALDAAPTLPRLLTSSRLAFDAGIRSTALRALELCLHLCTSGWPLQLEEPFLVPLPRYEQREPGASIDAFVTASAVEARETRRAFSSFFTGASALGDLEALGRLGYLEGQMRKRLELVRERPRR